MNQGKQEKQIPEVVAAANKGVQGFLRKHQAGRLAEGNMTPLVVKKRGT